MEVSRASLFQRWIRKTSRPVGNFSKNFKPEHPGEQIAVDASLAQSICKPGADIQAVGYRSMMIWMMTQIAREQIAPFLKDGQPTDALFHAAAKVPLEWMEVRIVQNGPPFDLNEFLRLWGREHRGTKYLKSQPSAFSLQFSDVTESG